MMGDTNHWREDKAHHIFPGDFNFDFDPRSLNELSCQRLNFKLPGDGSIHICDNQLLVFVDEEDREEDHFAVEVGDVVGGLEMEIILAGYMWTIFEFFYVVVFCLILARLEIGGQIVLQVFAAHAVSITWDHAKNRLIPWN